MAEQQRSLCKSFERPDERRAFKAHGRLDLVSFGDEPAIGRGVFEPGWRWSSDVKPIAGTESCEAEHTGYCISGSMIVRMNNGEELKIGPGDAFHLLPGHDAWVVGDEPCVMLDFTGVRKYAKPEPATKAA